MAYRDKVSGVYLIKNKSTGEVYVGSSVDALNRLIKNKNYLRRGIHHSKALQKSYNKHGESKFTFKIVEEVKSASKKDLKDKENEYFDKNRKKLLNFAKQAESTEGISYKLKKR